MRADIPSALPLICPGCRVRTERGLELFTLSLEHTLRSAGEEVLEGVLRCDNPACARRFPILDGIPLVVADLAQVLATQLPLIVEGELSAEIAGLLALAGPDDAPYAKLVEHLSVYLDAHWGDRADPPPDGPLPDVRFGLGPLAARVAARATDRVGRAVELGCNVGRGLAELSRGADLTVGIDLHFGVLRRARRILAGEALSYPRKTAGRHYLPATIRPEPAPGTVALICGDGLDPPLAPHTFQRVMALNLLDSVPKPALLLSVVDGLCAPGGEVLLASPYAWQSDVVAEDARLGTTDPAAEVTRRLRTGDGLQAAYTVSDEADVPWSLRMGARSAQSYAVHYLRARKA